MAEPWEGLHPFGSGGARRFNVRPCRFENEDVVPTTPGREEWWGVYYQYDNSDEWLPLSDHDTENDALATAFHFAAGRAVYSFDPVNGERLAKDPDLCL